MFNVEIFFFIFFFYAIKKKCVVLFPMDVTKCSFKRDGERMRMTAITITVVVIMEVEK